MYTTCGCDGERSTIRQENSQKSIFKFMIKTRRRTYTSKSASNLWEKKK